jgi:HSP20 family protein
MAKLNEWSPFRTQVATLPSPWTEVFDRFMTQNGETNRAAWSPRVDVVEAADSYTFVAEAPGLRAEDIQIQLVGDTLTISGEKKQEKRDENGQWHLIERRYGSFSRSFTFPVAVDVDNVEAMTRDGILTVKVMKSKEATPKKINVKQA